MGAIKPSKRDVYLTKKYGITEADFQSMLKAQDGCCAICHKPPKRTLNVDHDHKTKRVRGLLCFRCNKFVIGRYRDSTLLKAAVVYLDREAALGLE